MDRNRKRCSSDAKHSDLIIIVGEKNDYRAEVDFKIIPLEQLLGRTSGIPGDGKGSNTEPSIHVKSKEGRDAAAMGIDDQDTDARID